MHTLFLSTLILSFSLFNTQKNTMKVGDKIIQIDSTGTVNNLSLKYENGFDPKKFKRIELNKKILFLNQSSGIVYEMKNDSIVRIDNSYNDNVHNLSLDFVHRDTLFRFGGYGYFNNNKNLIFYDEKLNEWDIINYKNRSLIDPFNSVGAHFIRDNKLYVFGYYTIKDESSESELVKKGFVFDFNKREITKSFDLLDSFEHPRSYFDLNKDYVLLINRQREGFILNKETLDFNSYNLNTNENSVIYNSDYLIIENGLYFERKDSNMNSEVTSLNIDSLIDNMIKKGSFIKSKWYSLFHILMILSGLVFTFIMKKIFLKKKSFSLNEKTLNYGRIQIELNDKMIEVLYLLLNQEKVSNSQLLDIFYVKNQNRIHINREKNNCIDRINLMFELKTNKQLIQKEKSLLDNRMIDYYLNKDLL